MMLLLLLLSGVVGPNKGRGLVFAVQYARAGRQLQGEIATFGARKLHLGALNILCDDSAMTVFGIMAG